MLKSDFLQTRLACAYMFLGPSLIYGTFTSRLPAFRTSLALDDSQIGLLMLFLGGATLLGLVLCGLVIDKFGSKIIIGLSTVWMMAAITLAGLGLGFWQTAGCCFLAGLGVGFCDVGLNTQAIYIEKEQKILCLSFLHGSSSLGGVLGALAGSACARFDFSPFLNLAAVCGVFFLFFLAAYRKIINFKPEPAGPLKPRPWKGIAFSVYMCGILSLLCHIPEGSAAEWGSLLLHVEKGASQQVAALAFAAFTGCMVLGRLVSDWLRHHVSDMRISICGSLLAALGMGIAILSPLPLICLAGLGLMGLGLAPVVPILFSVAGSSGSATPGQASAIVSILSYSGMLILPPFLGMLSQSWGLENSLWLVAGICLLLALGSMALSSRKK